MKIRAIHTYQAGPLGTQVFDFHDDWGNQTASRILFSGPNGCGKSSVLRAVAVLWSALSHWLHARKPLPRASADREWLQRWGGVAMVLEGVPFTPEPVLIYFGQREWAEGLANTFPASNILGEWVERNGTRGAPARTLVLPGEGKQWVDEWTKALLVMVASAEPSKSPNMIFLDAEERRWVTPRRRVGEMRSDNLQNRWLSRYLVSDDWDGQLEASLLTMKSAALQRFHSLIRDMNTFLSGKEILADIKLGENRLRVKLKDGSGNTHGLDELSAGEHQVLILLYQINRWLEKGGVALIDEPDLYMHPSLVAGLLSQLEKMVEDRGGQLLITSHVPEVWQRYDAVGQRVLLGQTAAKVSV
jgi:energy-coupling factor transporter ATP-binding protein EcfA2